MKYALFTTALLATGMATAAVPIDGWYTSIFGGYTSLAPNINTHHWSGALLTHSSYNGGYNAGGRIGYQSNPIRYELEYTYLNATANRFRVNSIGQNHIQGSSTANFIMANLYYDFPEFLAAISPFAGIGIGYAFMQATLEGEGPLGLTHFEANGNAFAYQGTVGLTYNFSENYALNASYRYTATGNNDNFGTGYKAQMGNVGIVYHFDTGTYK